MKFLPVKQTFCEQPCLAPLGQFNTLVAVVTKVLHDIGSRFFLRTVIRFFHFYIERSQIYLCKNPATDSVLEI